MLTSSNAKAYAVLAILFDMYGDYAKKLYVKPSVNGRENGFHVQSFNNRYCVTFAEMRGCDAIAIYYGESIAFNMQGLGPTDKTYREQSKSFNYNEYLEAAEWIKEFLDQSNEGEMLTPS